MVDGRRDGEISFVDGSTTQRRLGKAGPCAAVARSEPSPASDLTPASSTLCTPQSTLADKAPPPPHAPPRTALQAHTPTIEVAQSIWTSYFKCYSIAPILGQSDNWLASSYYNICTVKQAP
jgi:hypothetical protein